MALVQCDLEKQELLKAEKILKELQNYYQDLNDIVIAVRQTAKIFDIVNN